MTTPHGPHGDADDHPQEPPAWGRQPAGGWGGADPRAERAPRGRPHLGRPGHPSAPPWQQQPPPAPPPQQPAPWQHAAEPPHWAGQQTWGAPPPPAAPPPEPAWDYPALPEPVPRDTRRRPVIAGGVALAVLALVGLLGFVSPGFLVTRVFEAGALEAGVAQVLTRDYGYGEVADVRCGDAVEVVEGARFACNATVDGAPVSVPVTVTSGDGEYAVGRPR